MMDFDRGDSVRLKSGGPIMTVSGFDDGKVECWWTDANGETETGSFPPESLKRPRGDVLEDGVC